MKTSNITMVFFVSILFTPILQGQQAEDDHFIVKQFYDILQNKNATNTDIANLAPEIEWNAMSTLSGPNNKHHITVISIIKNEWGNIIFKDLKFQNSEENVVLVTGTVKGRKPSECDYISYRFKHYWSLNNGRLINFLE